MNRPKYTKTKTGNIAPHTLSNLFSINAVTAVLAALCLAYASASVAEWREDDPDTVVYVDSIHQWGPWELDIEPAAGGIQPPSSKALNARDSKVSLRTNSIAALAPTATSPVPAPAPVVVTTPTTPIAPPVVPVTPPAPPVKPPVTPPRPVAPVNFAPPGATPPMVVTLPGKFR